MQSNLDPILAQVQKNLEAAIAKSGTAPLSSDTLGSVGADVLSLFSSELGAAAIVLGGNPSIVADAAKDTLLVTGSAEAPLLGMANAAIAATFAISGQTLTISMTVTPSSAWTLATSFPLTAKTALAKVTLDPGTPIIFFLLSAAGSAADAFGALMQRGLNVSLGVTLAAPLNGLTRLIPAAPTPLPLAGPVQVGAKTESLSLRSAAPKPYPSFSMAVARLLALPFSDVAPVLESWSSIGDDGQQADDVFFGVWGRAPVAATTLRFSISVGLGSTPVSIGLLPDFPVTFGEVAALVSSIPVLSVVPDAVQGLNPLAVGALTIQLTSDLRAFRRLEIVIESSPSASLDWVLIPGAIELRGVRVLLTIVPSSPESTGISGTFEATLMLGSVPVIVTIALPIGSGPWSITGYPDVALPDLGALASLLGGHDLAAMLPAGLGHLGGFTLAALGVTIDPKARSISSIEISLASSSPWTIVENRLAIQNVGIDLTVATPFSSPGLSGNVTGTLEIGQLPVQVMIQRIDPSADWYFSVSVTNLVLPSLADLAHLAGIDLTPMLPGSLPTAQLELVQLQLEVDLTKRAIQTFSVSVSNPPTTTWTVIPDYLVVQYFSVSVSLDWRSGSLYKTGSIAGGIIIPAADELALYAEADYPGTGGWLFKAGMQPGTVFHLKDAVKHFLPAVHDHVPDITISGVLLQFDTSDGSYEFQASADWLVSITQDISFDVEASVDIKRQIVSGTPQYSGSLSGDVKGYFGTDALELKAIYGFQPNNSTITFELIFKGVSLTCVVTKTKTDTILTVQLGGLTFGGIIEYLMNLAGASGFTLSSPWSVLNDISFDNLMLTINVTQKTVGIAYKVGKNFGIVDIETIGLTYLRRNGSGTVDITITGTFAGTTYGAANPLTWDMLNDPPPAPAGTGTQLFDLEYLGIGQHLALTDAKADTMTKVIADLEQTVLAADSGPAPWTLLTFDSSSSWLFGAQFTIMETLALGLVFNDPNLYGLRITLSGKKAEILAGLEFEILYRKITDDIGVYHIELKLPDAMRHLEFGEVSITLPVVILDIYTNGNFRVDFGFPANGDFTNSFAIEVFPFIGAGGFYFALLSGATSTSVPKITNGTFNPVIEFGFGLSVGVGKDISEGPLQAGASLTVNGLLQGVIGWFNPTDKSVPADKYYWIKGTIALVGKLYGKIDFVVVSAELSVVAYASATLVIESFQPIFIELSVGVSVTASIKIVFVTLHFSFSMNLDLSFTIGSASTPPWQIASSSGGGSPSRNALHTLLGRRRHAFRRRTARALRSAFARALAGEANGPSPWPAVAVLPNAPVPLVVEMLPGFTVAGAPNPATQVVMSVMAPNDVPVTAGSQNDVKLSATGSPGTTAFDQLCLAVLLWAIQSQTGSTSGTVTEVDLHDIAGALDDPAHTGVTFTYANVANFLAANVMLLIGQFDAGGPPVSAAVVPMPPPLTMGYGNGSSVNFLQQTPVDPSYGPYLSAYFAQLSTNYDIGRANDPFGPPPAPPPPGPAQQSLASALFADYFLMLTKSAVNNAVKLMQSYPHAASAGDSLLSIAQAFSGNVSYVVQALDTVYTIAAEFDVPFAVIEAANSSVNFSQPLVAGTVLEIPPPLSDAEYVTTPTDTLASVAAAFGTTRSAVQAANPKVDFANLAANTLLLVPVPALMLAVAEAIGAKAVLATGTSLSLRGAVYTVQDGDTLGSIAVTKFEQPDATGLVTLNANAAILQPGASIAIASAGQAFFPYVVRQSDTYATIAAYVLVRDAVPSTDPNFAWYAQTIASLNPSIAFYATDPASGVLEPVTLPSGTTLTIPVGSAIQGGVQPTGTTTYLTAAGDTLPLVAGYFLMEQINAADLTALANAIQTLNPNIPVGTTISIPQQTHVVVQGETFASIAALFGVSLADLARTNAATSGLLRPLAQVSLPPLTHPVAAGDTLSAIAGAYGFTLDALAGRLATVPGLFATEQTVTVPNAPQVAVADLQTTFLATGQANTISGIVSRFFLHGLQIPIPTNLSAFAPLHVLSGAQFPSPSDVANFTVSFTNPTNASWIVFDQSYTTVSGDTLASLATKFGLQQAQIQQINPGVNFNPLQPQTVVLIPTGSLDVVVPSTVARPSTTFDPAITSGPVRLPLADLAPVRYTFGTHAAWRSASTIPFPGPAGTGVSVPTLWSFPSALLAAVAAAPGQHPFELVAGNPGDLAAQPTPIAAYDWATIIPFRIRQVPAADGSALANTYVVDGADQDGRNLLVALLEYLDAPGNTDTAQLWLLTPAGSPGATTGTSAYTSDALDPNASLLLQTNLSTLTQSGVGPLGEMLENALPPSGTYYATVGAGNAFVRLLWEASIVGSGGFYLNYVTTSGAGLPSNAFANGSEATLSLVVILNSQSAGSNPALYAFSNCAVVRDSLDPQRTNVFAEATDGSSLTLTSTVPPGNVGFTLARTNPSTPSPSAAQLTQALYSLLDYDVPPASNTFFASSLTVLPAGPVGSDSTANRDVRRSFTAPSDDPAVWTYQTTIPIWRLAIDPPAQLAAAFPPAANNPYAGIAPGSQITVDLSFRDVYGNDLASTPAIPAVTVPAGYTDPVIALSSWPNAAAGYAFALAGSAPVVTVTVDLDLTKYVPSSSVTVTSALYSAASHLVKYRQIWYQIAQSDTTVEVQTCFDQPGAAALPNAAARQALVDFAAAAYAFLNVVSTLEPVSYTTTASGETPNSVCTSCGIAPPKLFEANASPSALSRADASLLFTGPLTIPQFHVAAAADTLAAAAGQLAVAALLSQNEALPLTPGVALRTAALFYTTVAGDSIQSIATLMGAALADIATANATTSNVLAAGAQVTVGGVTLTVTSADTFATLVTEFAGKGVVTTPVGIAQANATLAGIFATGATIAIAQTQTAAGNTSGRRTVTVGAKQTVDQIVQAQACTLGGLAAANAQTANLLAPGAVVSDQGVSLPVQANDTLVTLVAKFATEHVSISVADLLAANQSLAGLFATNAQLVVPDYVVQRGDTLASILAANTTFALADIAARNQTAPAGIFPAGTPLYLGATTEQALSGASLAEIAQANAISIDQLAAANVTTPFAVGAVLAIPGALAFDAALTADQWVTYRAPLAGITLAGIATNWNSSAGAVATANASTPALFLPNVKIAYPGKPVTTQAGDTFASLALRAGAAVDVFAADPSVSALGGLIAGGALFAMPLPVAGNRTLAQLASDCNVCVDDLAVANSALVGLVQPSAKFTVGGVTIAAGQNDTLQTLVYRFLTNPQKSVITSVAQLAEANQTAAVLNPASPFLVPPLDAVFDDAIALPHVPAPIFPIRVEVAIARNSDLIDPEFGGVADVAGALSPVAPFTATGSGSSLAPFAQQFESTFASVGLKLATGPQTAGSTGSSRSLWAVSAAKNGVIGATVEAARPLYYALAPLSTKLESRSNVPIPTYDPATGVLDTAHTTQQTFQAVDLDVWLTQLLEAIDVVLSPDYAVNGFLANPRAFEAIVTAKGQIASYLSGLVTPILAAPAPQPTAAQLAAAREALYQSMLVTLGSAVTTDALVQFGVSVTSPWSQPYTTGGADTFAQPAAYYGVDPAAVAAALANETDILRTGALVAYASSPYTIAATDTLATIATHYNVTVGQLASGLSVQDGGGLFAPNTTLGASATAYTPTSADTVQSAATWLGVTADELAVAAQGVAGIFQPGASIALEGHPAYTVKAGDTLAVIAAAVGVTPQAVAADPTVVNRTGLLSTSVTLHAFGDGAEVAPRISGKAIVQLFVAGPASQFADALAYYRVSANALANALRRIPRILNAGATVTYALAGKSQSLPIEAGDTLATLAARFGANDIAKFAVDLVVENGLGLFAPNTSIPLSRTDQHDVVQAYPNASFSTAKAPLTGGESTVTFLFSTPSDAMFRNLYVTLDYSVNELEFDVTDVAGISGYQASNWLTFALPVGGASDAIDGEIGLIDIPIPLRLYPSMPSAVAQSGTPTNDGATTFPAIKEWDFAFSYLHQDSAQDTPHIEVTFNDTSSYPRAMFATFDPFATLAPFAAIYPRLQPGLAQLLQPSASTPQFLSSVVQSFSTLVSAIGSAWTARAGQRMLGEPPPVVTTKFALEYTYTEDNPPNYDRLELVRTDGPPTPVWPEITVTTAAAGPVRLTRAETSSDCARYTFPAEPAIPVPTTMTVAFAFDRLDVVLQQSGWGGVWVARNADLVSTAPTAAAFLYETPLVRFTDTVIPLIANDAIVPIGGTDLPDAIASMLGTLLNVQPPNYDLTGDYTLKFTVAYGHTLVPATAGADAVVSYVPILLQPSFTLGPSYTIPTFVGDLRRSLNAWIKGANPVLADGDVFLAGITLYSTIPGENARPLLHVTGLTYTIATAVTAGTA